MTENNHPIPATAAERVAIASRYRAIFGDRTATHQILSADVIRTAFARLNERLSTAQMRATINLVGGGGMTLVHQIRPHTDDVDGWIAPDNFIQSHMQRLAEPRPEARSHAGQRGPATGGKRVSAQPLMPSTVGMLDGGEGTVDLRTHPPCIGPFAHGDQAHRAQGSRGPSPQRGDARTPCRMAFQAG